MNRKLANCSLALAWALGLAGGATANTPSSADGVVRVEGTKPGTGGTGTLIGISHAGDDLRLAVLSADHTLQRVGALTTIGFGDASAPKLDFSAASATSSVVGIQSSGSDVVDGQTSIGLRMTDAYANWVNATVSAYVSPVPEPAG